ncbi:MAG: DUF2461 domain-containing protein [Synechococcaceae cyanobacterium RM1_1_27]|nr:DUF2461 domain-containing protein [Synechococcaceae cyanobacterium SM2_3_2]NJO85542.1 DUF2461 domain-containing protein [Synechococcaceae cyanobacterium RM1_1_27]
MSDLHFTPRAFDLLEELAANNHKDWYTQHREEIEIYLRDPFARVLEAVTQHLAQTKVPLAGGAKTMFRQHRDVRFSKDKSPYSTHVSGLLTPSGTKSENQGLLFLQLDSSGGMIACGFYKFKADQLAGIRDKILAEPEVFSRVLEELDEAFLSLSDEDKLTKMPRGYEAHAAHPHAEYLKLKSLIAQTSLSREVWISGDILDRIVEMAKGCEFLLAFGEVKSVSN